MLHRLNGTLGYKRRKAERCLSEDVEDLVEERATSEAAEILEDLTEDVVVVLTEAIEGKLLVLK